MRRVLEALEGLPRTSYSGLVYRHYAPAYGALDGGGARRLGGRWNPPQSFPVIYTGSSVLTVDAEFRKTLRAARLPVTGARKLATIKIDLTRVLDLRAEATRHSLGVTLADLAADDPSAPQAIGAAAHLRLAMRRSSPRPRPLSATSSPSSSQSERPSRRSRSTRREATSRCASREGRLPAPEGGPASCCRLGSPAWRCVHRPPEVHLSCHSGVRRGHLALAETDPKVTAWDCTNDGLPSQQRPLQPGRASRRRLTGSRDRGATHSSIPGR